MFILTICFPLLLMSFIWHKFTDNSKLILRFAFVFVFSFYFISFYSNGADWSIYYLKFLGDDNPYLSFEFGFVLFLKALLFVSSDNFGLAILFFYLITFSLLALILNRYKVNEPLFYTCLFLLFGYTLLLEQLRQFLACIIVFYALLSYNESRSWKKLYSLLIVAACFHISSLIFIPALVLVSFRNVTLFVTITLLSVVFFAIALFTGYAIIHALEDVSFAFKKIAYYLQQNPLEIRLGWLNLFDAVYVVFYCFYRKTVDKISDIKFLTRIIFVGAVIHLFSGAITFLARVSFFFYFVAVYTFCITPLAERQRLFVIKSFNTLALSIFFSFILLFSFISYFRNDIAPVKFSDIDFNFTNVLNDKYMYSLAIEKYSDAMGVSINEK